MCASVWNINNQCSADYGILYAYVQKRICMRFCRSRHSQRDAFRLFCPSKSADVVVEMSRPVPRRAALLLSFAFCKNKCMAFIVEAAKNSNRRFIFKCERDHTSSKELFSRVVLKEPDLVGAKRHVVKTVKM
jgi:hypothetical protein